MRKIISRKSSQLRIVDVFFFAIIAGILATFAKGYFYGSDNQVEQLPIILRFINADYLRGDFFTNAAAVFGPRYYYAKLLAFISTVHTLPYVFLILTLLSNCAVAVITAYFSFRLFKSRNTALFAVLMVMCISFTQLSGTTDLFQSKLTPQVLAMPFLLSALGFAIFDQLFLCSLFVSIGSLIHPGLGLGTAGILFLAIFIYRTFLKIGKFRINQLITLESVISMGVFLGVILAWTIPTGNQPHIPTTEFAHIFAYERSPHHILPKTFPLYLYVEFFFFLIGTVVSFYHVKNKQLYSPVLKVISIIIILTLALCLAAYLFADVAFIRFWASIQPFRLLYLIKWFTYLLVAKMINDLFEKGVIYKTEAYLLLVSLLSPILIGVIFTLYLLKNFLFKHAISILENINPGLLFVFVILFFVRIAVPQSGEVTHFTLLLLFMLFIMSRVKQRVFTAVLGMLLFMTILFIQPTHFFPPAIAQSLQQLKPVITVDDISWEVAALGHFAKANTSNDSIFLTPRFFGEFRLIADRAIVVDYKSIPFQDLGMRQWYARIVDIYGIPKASDPDGKDREYEANYQHLTSDRIKALQRLYGFSYAILYKQTSVEFPVLFESEHYKLVKITNI